MTEKSAWQKYKESLGDTRPWHLLLSEQYEKNKELVAERLSICKECPELIKLTTQCKQCGCFMNLKTKLADATCPLGKW
jgi:hypothetical protein